MPPKLTKRKRAAGNQQVQLQQVTLRDMLKVRVAKRMMARKAKMAVLEVKTEKMIMASLRTWTCRMMKKNLAMI
tara:strand:- start:802 stop:1023 length:222 start_codon:yes stop_codon:yes gene_type:complete